MCIICENKRKYTKLEIKTDEQCKKYLNCYHKQRIYLKNITNITPNKDSVVNKDLNQQ